MCGDYSSALFTKWQLLKISIICERESKQSLIRGDYVGLVNVLPEVLVTFQQF